MGVMQLVFNQLILLEYEKPVKHITH